MRPASHSSGVFPFIERPLGFLGESSEDNVLDGFITREVYVIDNELLTGDGKNNGNKLAAVRVARYLNLPIGLQVCLGTFRHFYQIGYLV